MEYAVRYLRIIFISSLFVNFAQAANMVMRGEGVMKKAMTIMGLSAVLNIILNPILLSVTKNIEGAAYATIISQFVQACVTLWYFTKKSKNVRIGQLHLNKIILCEVLGVGVSAMLMQVMQLVQQTHVQHGPELWRKSVADGAGGGIEFTGLCFHPAVGHEPRPAACGGHQLRCKGLWTC